MNDDDPPANRIIAVVLGVSVAAVCAFFAWGAFALLASNIDPALSDADYWSAVRAQARANPTLAGLLVLFVLGTGGSVGLMAWSLVRSGRRRG